MGRNAFELASEGRDKVWLLMLEGKSPQSIKRELNLTNPTVYRDIEFLTKKSKQYVFDMAKGLYALSYQRAIEGLELALSAGWGRFNDPKVLEKHKVAYLRLIIEINSEIFALTANGPSVIAIDDLRKRIEKINLDLDHKNVGVNFNPPLADDTTDKYDSAHNTIN